MLLLRSLVALLFVTASMAHSETLVGRIIGVSDGDTLTLLDATNQTVKIRLSGIDAPEKKQAFGQKSKASLSNLAYGRQAEADCRKRDRYQRSLCVVRVNGTDVGFEQIRTGMAWWYRQYARDQRPQERAVYEQAEMRSRQQGFGLWQDSDPTPPWEWRHQRPRNS